MFLQKVAMPERYVIESW